MFSALMNQLRPKRLVSALQLAFPILSWIQNYNITKFKVDFIASIGDAPMAKLEPQYGLYTSAVPPLIYAALGTSRDIVIGPVAVDSLLLSSMIQKLTDPRTGLKAYKRLLFTATFFAGVFQVAFGIFRLGFLVDFLSHAAIVAFMAGAAIIIGLQQLKGPLGIANFTHNTDIISVMISVFRGLNNNQWHYPNLILGFSCLSFILTTRFLGTRNMKLFWLSVVAPLLSFILSTLVVYLTNAKDHRIDIVKQVQEGLNPSSVRQLQFDGPYVGGVAKIGFIVAVAALTETMAVGRSFASLKGYHINANKEMVSLGFMNIIGSMTSCYIATGSFSRTAVNFNAGGETLMSNAVMAATVMISLKLFTSLMYYTPVAVIAAIACLHWGLLWRIVLMCGGWPSSCGNVHFCLLTLYAYLTVVLVTISFLKIILVSIQPGIENLGRLPGTDTFCDVDQYPMAVKIPGVLIIRVKSAWLCFANSNSVRERYSISHASIHAQIKKELYLQNYLFLLLF
ncbi:sulfate transporter 2.1 [Quercus suber]|uniref:Sulfate transporter 2.1 n=1 Tax=Quercus suber TaxID=58331 RepID=A0AAW0M1C0_QUESU